MLFHVIPLAGHLDRVEATPAREHPAIGWDDEARALFEAAVAKRPVLTRISEAKALRDAAEAEARRTGADSVRATVIAGLEGRS